MDGITNLWAFMAAGLLLNLTPGPDTFYILGRSTAQGSKVGLLSALGIGLGSWATPCWRPLACRRCWLPRPWPFWR
jgi:threonine/homoserine/homoserine lactone efflux protein